MPSIIPLPPLGTVRGNVSHYLQRHRHLLGSPVLEIGSRCDPARAWWADIRGQIGDGLEWVGIDMQPGYRVDRVCDATELPFSECSFRGVVCAEMLEHAQLPERALCEAFRVLKAGCWALITTPFGFPVHDFPSDYWRFTSSGLRLLLERVGFAEIEIDTAGSVPMTLDDHGTGVVDRKMPMHILARAKKAV